MEKIIDFDGDAEKMADFTVLSKEEFLKKHGYLTEDEYDTTKVAVSFLAETLTGQLIQRVVKLENHIHYQDMFGGGATGQPVFPKDKAESERGDE